MQQKIYGDARIAPHQNIEAPPVRPVAVVACVDADGCSLVAHRQRAGGAEAQTVCVPCTRPGSGRMAPLYMLKAATHCQAHASATALPIAAISARAKARARTEKGVRPTNSRVEDPARVVRQAVKLKCNMSSAISLGPAKDHPHPFNLTFKAASLSLDIRQRSDSQAA